MNYFFGALLLLLTCVSIPKNSIWAATATPSSTKNPVSTAVPKSKVDELKDRLATKVAQLRQTEQKAIFGKVKAVSISSMTVETSIKDMKIELIEEIQVAQVVKGKRTSLTTQDIAKDDIITVFGDYDTTLDLLKAKAMYIQSMPPILLKGVVKAIDRKKFTLTILTPEKNEYIIDIEKFTKAQAWSKEGGIVKSGFSKIDVGRTVHIVGIPNSDEENRLRANRILDITSLSKSITPTNTRAPTETDDQDPTPSPKAAPKPTVTTTEAPTP